jgi:tripartite-type tricarboxylate transporter receptor subunit TctC
VRDKLAALGFEPMVMTPAEFASYVEKEIDVNQALVKATGIKAH